MPDCVKLSTRKSLNNELLGDSVLVSLCLISVGFMRQVLI